MQDCTDIQAMLEHNRGFNLERLISSWNLSEKHSTLLMELYLLAGA